MSNRAIPECTAAGAGQWPIAIVGVGCRFPGGVDSAESYWRLLEEGIDAIGETPRERWAWEQFYAPDSPRLGKTHSRWGGYVDGIDQFDPGLFGISPREAAAMDPQQRMLLEVAFRAMEDAGHPPSRLAGGPVSVYVGISSIDYAVAGLSFEDRGVITPYSNTGASTSIAANRISYCFDLRGPSVAVDTACSSSLVAVHMACQSLWNGEARLALAGGVNALILPDFYIAFSQLGVLSPDGRCKTFDARANGYVRSEGAGMVLLKPLPEALRDGDFVYAVIRGTALNQDGRTPGMTVPSSQAQQALVQAACERAGVRAVDFQYVEAHGTGTPVGDPIEANALGAVLGTGRSSDAPCWVGSVKTNIGHLEAGAGIASLIKVALSLHHERIPPHLHFIHPNPAIDFETLRLRVPTRMQSWQRGSAPRLAGINGFGYGGANAHVIVQEAPLPQRAPTPSVPRTRAFRNEPTGRRGASDVEPAVAGAPCVQTSPTADASPDRMSGRLPILLPLSARSVEGLRQSAAHLADWLEAHPDIEPAEVAGFLAHRREHFEVRATVCQSSDRELVQDLRMLAASTSEELVGRLSVNGLERGIAMVCSGQGPQWWAMGRGMLKYSPAFRSVIRQCDREFARWADWSLWTELTRSQNESRMHQTSISQPCLFALQIALARVWESWGIVPTVVLGHSVGEIAAAYISGALDFSDACRVAFHRGRTMDQATSRGAMIAAGVSPEEVPQWIAGFEQHVALAAVNGPSSVTISGDADAIEQVAQRLESSGVFCRRLAVEYAFHSPQMEPVRAPLLESLASICPRPTRIPFLSTVTGDFLDGTELTAEYWWRNVRQGVRFADAMYALAESGYEAVIELGPHPVLAYSIQECFQSRGRRVHSVGSLNRQKNDLLSMSKGLGDVYTCGFDIRWEGFYNRPSRRLEVPAYPFQLQRCWQESPQSRRARTLSSGHAWLGQPSDGAEPSWRNRVDLAAYPCLRDHALKAGVVYPAAAAVETMLAAAQRVTGAEQVRLESIQIDRACVLDDANPQYLDTKYDADRRRVELAFRPVDQDQGWQRLATGQVSRAPIAPAGASETAELGRIKQQCNESFDGARLYDYCERLGLFYGPAFRGVACGWRAAGQAVVEVETSAELLHEEVLPLNFHPATLDACFHAMIAADPSFDHTLDGLYLPSKIDRVELLRPAGDRLVVQARMLSKNQHRMRCDLMIFDTQGQVCMRIFGFESVRVASGHTEESVTDLVYAYRWIESEAAQRTAREDGDRSLALPSAEPHDQQAVVLPQPAVQAESTDTVDVQAWMICMDEGSVGRMLARQLRDAGYSVFEVYSGSSRVPQAVDGPHCLIDIETPAEYDRALEMAATALGSRVQGIVYLWGLDVPANDTLDEDQLHRSTQLTTLAPLFLVQALERREQAKSVRLVMVTAGAQSADDVPAVDAVAATPLIGFGRVVISECAKLSSKLVDLPASPQPGDITNLIWELQGDDGEDEIMWRQGRRWVRRFLPQREMPLPHDAQQSVRYRLSRGATANIDQLRFGTDACCELEPGQVEIEVQAASLNFSDVMKALDLYPGMPDGPPELGAECSGRIVRIGRGCPFQIGDEVVAIARGSFASHVVVDAALIAPKPPHLSHVEAAALPVAFLTAEYALQHCARLASSDKVLVHAATGGVGLAAIQLAQGMSVEVLATAGSEAKRRYLSELGIACVMDSRTLAFADETMRYTGGRGVDAVLNSLPGEAIAKGLSVLKPGGRFLEIGKRDIYDDAALGLYVLRNNLALFAIDLDQLFRLEPVRMGNMLRDLMDRFARQELRTLPVRQFAADRIQDAFRFMQSAQHIGKVVIDFTNRPQEIFAQRCDRFVARSDGTYWIAGGQGGFGLEIARWLVDRGARHLVLTARRSTPTEETLAAVAALQQQGAQVLLQSLDITRMADLRRGLEEIESQMPAVVGVFHTAMVLEDRLLVDLDPSTLQRVLAPKVAGGWNLHRLMEDRPLDCFVLFSSLSSVFGHAGQANYAAANALLDGLASYRRGRGLPATVINWGHLGEVGYLARRQQLGERLERQGVLSFSVRQATECLEFILQNRLVQASVLRMDWSRWRGLGLTHRVSPRFAHLIQTGAASGDAAEAMSAEQLSELPQPQRIEAILDMLRAKASSLLGVSATRLGADSSLLEMGLDSLMAVELRNWLERKLGVNLPVSGLMRSTPMQGIAETVSSLLVPSAATAAGSSPPPSNSTDPTASADSVDNLRALDALAGMSDADVNQLLNKLLKEESGH